MTPEVKKLLEEHATKIEERDAKLEERAARIAELEAQLEQQRQEWLAERERLMKELDTLLKHCKVYDARIEDLKRRIKGLNKRLYGRTSEVREGPLATQDDLFGKQPEATEEEKKEEAVEPKPRRRRSPRKPIPAHLERKAVVIDVEEGEKACEGCGGERRMIGEDITEEVESIPAQLFVRQTRRPKYACSKCKDGVVQAKLPPRLLPQSIAGTSLVAALIIAKYMDHIPLCRMERILARHDIDIDRAQMSSWLMKAAEWAEPLTGLMKERLADCFVLGADETPIQMQLGKKLHPRGKAVKKCYMWVYHGDEYAPFTVYDFQETRGRDGPKELLKSIENYLQCDAYAAYRSLEKSEEYSFTRAGCMAHARRKFVDASDGGDGRAEEPLAFFRSLYAVERKLPGIEEAKKTEYRQKHAGPILEELKKSLTDRLDVLAGSALGKAIGYTLDNWDALLVYLRDARIPIDNNAVERAIRPIALGRRNWLFAGSPRGGRAAATFFTLLESCRRNGHNPWLYMNDILTRLPTTPRDQLHTLLPDVWKPAANG
jgi:transposase